MQAVALRISTIGHRNVTKPPVAPIELRIHLFVGREQKAEPRRVNSRRFVRLRRALDLPLGNGLYAEGLAPCSERFGRTCQKGVLKLVSFGDKEATGGGDRNRSF